MCVCSLNRPLDFQKKNLNIAREELGAGRGGKCVGRREGRGHEGLYCEGACLVHRFLPAAETTPNTRVLPPCLPLGDGARRSKIHGSADIPERLIGKVYAGIVLAVLLYGCES